MTLTLLMLTFLNVVLLLGLSFSVFLRIKEKKEDQRLTKGLQLLQNKISILEDLSDRTDEQVHKLVHLIDQKANEVRHHLTSADQKIEQIDTALSKALDISKVFNEQVPHQELMDRQKTSAYVQAAKMANQGFSIEQISAKVDLSPAEIEMITKVNKDTLQFSEDALPAWINPNSTSTHQDDDLNMFTKALNEQNQKNKTTVQNSVQSSAFDTLSQDLNAQNSLRKEFDKTVKNIPQNFVEKTVADKIMPPKNYEKNLGVEMTTTANGSTKEKSIRPMEFKKIVSHRG